MVGKLLTKTSSFVKSKVTVFIAMAVMLLGVVAVSTTTTSQADVNYGTIYQKYLLIGNDAIKDAQDKKIAVVGTLGSGGVSGQFSYDDIISSATTSEGRDSAKTFATAMATYSKYNYLTYKPQSFSSIISIIGRSLLGMVLFVFGLLSDTITLLYTALVNFIGIFNVIPLLSTAISGSNYAGQLQSALGLSADTIKTFISVMLSFLIASILIALYMGLYRGASHADKGALSKAKGRLFSLVALPMAVILASGLISQVSDMATKTLPTRGSYADYMVDDKNWAFKYNLAPNGADTGTDGSLSAKDGYIDTKFNPYTNTGKQQLATFNKKSKIATHDGNFSNTSLALEYMMLDTFDSKAYIGYKTSKQSQTDGAVGSIYALLKNDNGSDKPSARKVLADIDNNYGSRLVEADTYNGNDDQKPADANYGKAQDDYIKDKKLRSDVSASTAWVDRFIYGYKSSGSKLKDYYNAPVSREQIEMNFGNDSGYGLSDESAYLALNTQFNATGGKYLLDAPSRGILSAKATFDSNRADYYTVSIVGVPFFTALGMLSTIVIQLVVLTATVLGIISLGLLDMNIKPLMAWFKGITKGDIEYAGAFLIYSGGVAGTILTVTFVPMALTSLLTGASNFIISGLGSLGQNPISDNADAGLATGVLSQVGSFAFSAIVLGLFLKSPDFRKKLIMLVTLPWAWASESGHKMELRADGNVGASALKNAQAKVGGNKALQAMDVWNDTHNGKTTQQLGSFASGLASGRTLAEAKDDAKLAGRLFDRDKGKNFSNELGKVFGFDSDVRKEKSNEPFITDELREELNSSPEVASALSELESNPTQENADKLNDVVKAHNRAVKLNNLMNPDNKESEIELPDKMAEQLHDGTAVERLVNAKKPIKIDETVENEPVLEPGQTKQIDNATFNARQALSDLKAKHPEMDDALIDDTENALREFELEPSEQNLDNVIQQLNKVHENVEMDGDTENDFKVTQDGMADMRDIAQDFDAKTQDALAQTDKSADVVLGDKQVETTTQGTAKVSGKQTIDLTTDQSDMQTETNVVPDTNESNADRTIDLGNTTSTGNVKAVGKRTIDLATDQSGVQTETTVTDSQAQPAQPDVKLAPTNEPVTDHTIDVGNTTSTGKAQVVGKRTIDLTTDQSGVQTETTVNPTGAKPVTPDVKLAPSNEPVADQTVDMGTTTSTGTAKAVGKRVINVATTDATTQDVKTHGLTGSDTQKISRQVAQDFDASQVSDKQKVDVSGQARGKATLQGSRRRVIDVSDATTTSGDTTINRVNKADLKQTLDEAEFAKTDVPTDVDVNKDETKPRFGSRLFGRNKK